MKIVDIDEDGTNSDRISFITDPPITEEVGKDLPSNEVGPDNGKYRIFVKGNRLIVEGAVYPPRKAIVEGLNDSIQKIVGRQRDERNQIEAKRLQLMHEYREAFGLPIEEPDPFDSAYGEDDD